MGRRAVTVMSQTQKLLCKMGEQIRLPRLQRHLPSGLAAERAGVFRQAVTVIEKASAFPSAYAAVLQALGGLERDPLHCER